MLAIKPLLLMQRGAEEIEVSENHSKARKLQQL
jgi:hypothetical protein